MYNNYHYNTAPPPRADRYRFMLCTRSADFSSTTIIYLYTYINILNIYKHFYILFFFCYPALLVSTAVTLLCNV